MRNRVVLLLMLLSTFTFGQRYETVNYGFWSNSSVWKDGLKPNFAFSDTVIIRHPLVFDSTLVVLPDAYLKIDSSGALCGHEKLLTYSNVHVYGFFQVDTVRVDGGFFKIFGPGDCVATFQTQTTNGGMLSLSGGSLSVGPWFDCRESDFFYLTNTIEELKQFFEVMPNPTADYFTIKGNSKELDFVLCDYTGKSISKGIVNSKIDLTLVDNGIYFLNILKEGEIIHTEKIVKL